MTFVLSQDKVAYNQRVSVISAAVSIGTCVLVLVLALWVWSVRSARGFLDRISFRLLLWSMFFEIVYDINYIAVVESASPRVTAGGDPTPSATARCATGIYFMIGTMGVVNYLCTAIAVNLFITIVLGLNPIILKLERWYVGVSLFMGFFIPIIPAALGHFGYDDLYFVCWVRASNDRQRMINFVMDVYLWQLLSCLIATVCVAATLVKLFRQGRATSRALFQGGDISIGSASWDHSEPAQSQSRISRFFRGKRPHGKDKMLGHLEDRFIRIALRISLYPIALIIVNGVITIGDLYISAMGGVKTEAVYGLYRVYYFLYGGRGIFFAMLGLFVDPCLPRGLRAAWKAKFPSDSSAAGSQPPFPECVTPNGTRIDNLVASTVTNNGDSALVGLEPKLAALERKESNESVDMLHALLMSGPPEDHAHWTREYHSGPMGQEKMQYEDGIRAKRQSRRFNSEPTFQLPRFLRRKSRAAQSTRSLSSEKSGKDAAGGPGIVTIPELAATGPSPVPSLHAANADLASAASGVSTPQATPSGFTMTFAGVQMGDLPAGFDDHAHDVVEPQALRAAEAAAAEAAAAAAAAALAREQREREKPPLSREPSGGSNTPRRSGSGSGTPKFTFGALRRGSFTTSTPPAGTPLRRSSLTDSLPGQSASGSGSALGSGVGSQARSSRIPPERRATAGVGPGPLSSGMDPILERRERRERAREIAERLYEEMEAQL